MPLTKLIVVPTNNNIDCINLALEQLTSYCDEATSILVVDNASTDNTFDELQNYENVKGIQLAEPFGYGALIINAIEYARNFSIDYLIIVDPRFGNITRHIDAMLQKAADNFEIISCSISHSDELNLISPLIAPGNSFIITEKLNTTIGENLLDPFAPFKLLKISSMNSFELTDYSAGLLLQLWVQAEYFGLNYIEIKSSEDKALSFEADADYEEEELSELYGILETESYLYPAPANDEAV